MCTQARLVQADQVSDWMGMTHGGIVLDPRARLTAGEPAFLEVSIDPAAHGEGGLGRIKRLVDLKTERGQLLRFELVATVVP
jgi:hypothetical protein